MTAAKKDEITKKVTLTVEVPAKLWDKYFKMFGGQERFEIFWSSIVKDILRTSLEGDGNYRDSMLKWVDEVAKERNITDANVPRDTTVILPLTAEEYAKFWYYAAQRTQGADPDTYIIHKVEQMIENLEP